MNTPADILQTLYKTADAVRATGQSAETSRAAFERYVEFVRAFAAPGRMLDVGCGAGWSTYWFADGGYDATGIDLNPAGFEPQASDCLRFLAGSGLYLPFQNGAFDVAATHQCLEHVPDPAQMLNEMIRVVRPGGVVCVVGPNLLGVGPSVSVLTRYVWRARPTRRILFRDAEMPKHPFGNTLPEAVCALVRNVCLTARKTISHQPTFTMRDPDVRPPFWSDNDATYLCNPLDLIRFFRDRRCTVLRSTALSRGRWTRMLAGGTWVAARTPE